MIMKWRSYKLNTIIYVALLLVVVLLMPSCATQKMYLTLDVLRPGRVTFPENVDNILIVNNTVNQPAEFGHTTQLMDRQYQSLDINTDSAALYCLAGAVEDLAGIGFFQSVTLLEDTQNDTQSFFKLDFLTLDQIEQLCATYDADALIALNRIAIQDEINDYMLETQEYLSVLDAKSTSNWSIHYPGKEKFDVVSLSDSLMWDNTSYDRAESLNNLPNRADAAIDLSIYSGRHTIQRLLPRWDKVDRYFYLNKNELLHQGMDSIRHRNFEGALIPWLQAYQGEKNKTTKAYAAMNLAIAYELIGNIDQAVFYAKQAVEHISSLFMPNYNTAYNFSIYYQAVLDRKREIDILDKQM